MRIWTGYFGIWWGERACIISAAVILAGVCLTQYAQAQDFPSAPDWKVTAYLWTMALDGTVGIGPIEADMDLSFSDLLSDLNIGGAVAIKRDWGRNMMVADLQYYSLSPDKVDTPLGGTVGTGYTIACDSVSGLIHRF